MPPEHAFARNQRSNRMAREEPETWSVSLERTAMRKTSRPGALVLASVLSCLFLLDPSTARASTYSVDSVGGWVGSPVSESNGVGVSAVQFVSQPSGPGFKAQTLAAAADGTGLRARASVESTFGTAFPI